MLPEQFLAEHPDALLSANGLYNLGVLAFQNHQIGLARAALEKAARLAPWDSQIQELLRTTRSELTLSLGASSMDPGENSWSAASDILTTTPAQVLLALVIAAGSLSGWKSLRKMRSERWFRQPGILFFAGAWIFALIGGWALLYQRYSRPVFVRENIVFRSGPSDTYREIGSIGAGAQVRLLDQRGDWVQIRFLPDRVGWAQAKSILF